MYQFWERGFFLQAPWYHLSSLFKEHIRESNCFPEHNLMKTMLSRLGLSGTLAVAAVITTPFMETFRGMHNSGLFIRSELSSRAFAQNRGEAVATAVRKKAIPAVVTIKTNEGSGTGFIVSSNGLILTNAHVLEDADLNNIIVLLNDGRKLSAELVGFDSQGRDLAALRVYNQRALPIVSLARANSTQEGEPVVAIGSPRGLEGTVTSGIVSRIDRKRGMIQTDAGVNPGNSGGPLLNSKAEVIGVNTFIFLPKSEVAVQGNIGLNFAISVEQVQLFLASVQKGQVASASQRIGRGKLKFYSIALNGRAITGSIDSATGNFGDKSADAYEFQGKAGQQVAIEMNSQDIDPYLVLIQASMAPDGKTLQLEQVVAENDDIGSDNTNAKIVTILPKDGLYLVAASTLTQKAGKYSLRARVETSTASKQAQAANSLRFYCGESNDLVSQQNIPTTLAYVPERQGNIAVVRWQSQYFEQTGWSAKQRCQSVSEKFQKAYQGGKLNYLTAGFWNKQAVVCAVRAQEDACGSDYLFTLKPTNDPSLVLQQLTNVLTGRATGPLYQSSGSVYIDVKKLLQTAKLEPKR